MKGFERGKGFSGQETGFRVGRRKEKGREEVGNLEVRKQISWVCPQA